jgi:hypothetical protein
LKIEERNKIFIWHITVIALSIDTPIIKDIFLT